jgi:hypothetical protein
MENPFESINTRLTNIENLFAEILNRLPDEEKNNSNELLDFDQAVAFIRRPKSTLYSLVRKQEIPHSKVCRRLYFIKSDLMEWIKTGKVQTVDEISREADDILTNKK